jgi:hypothetical protein
MDNKDLIKKIYDNFINKVSRVDQRAKWEY